MNTSEVAMRDAARRIPAPVRVPEAQVGELYDLLLRCVHVPAASLARQMDLHPKRLKTSMTAALRHMVVLYAVNPVCFQELVANVIAVGSLCDEPGERNEV